MLNSRSRVAMWLRTPASRYIAQSGAEIVDMALAEMSQRSIRDYMIYRKPAPKSGPGSPTRSIGFR